MPRGRKRILTDEQRAEKKKQSNHDWYQRNKERIAEARKTPEARARRSMLRSTPEQKEKNRIAQLKRGKRYQEFLSTKRCSRCGFDDSRALCMHHIDQSKKESTLASIRSGSWDKFLAEAEKCVCLCFNCHSIVHQELRYGVGS